jgi:uncharacterized protein
MPVGPEPSPLGVDSAVVNAAIVEELRGLTNAEALSLVNADLPSLRPDILPGRGKAAADAPTTEWQRMAVGFSILLRRSGLAVPIGSVVTFAEALGAVGIGRRTPVYWAGRAVLVRKPEDIPTYDRAFAAFWMAITGRPKPPTAEDEVTLALDDADENDNDEGDDQNDDDDDPGETLSVRFSAVEVLRDKDFAEYSVAEFAEARAAMAKLRFVGSPRRSRRLEPVRGARHTARPDLRRTVRNALRTEGLPISRAFRDTSTKPRRIVLLCDVSGSMEAYARALLRFCQAAVVGRGRVEVFALGTRLTRITRELNSRDPDAALHNAAKRVVDWSGGTRLGDGMRAFNDQWGVRGMARQSVIVILSDGWDRGDPETLAAQMERLHRVAHKVVWVNPLKAAPGYAPLARGMAAALPHVDNFIEGHSLASIEALAQVLATC